MPSIPAAFPLTVHASGFYACHLLRRGARHNLRTRRREREYLDDRCRVAARLMLASALAVVGMALVRLPDASSETMLWRVKSNYPYKVETRFYSQNRLREWGAIRIWGYTTTTPTNLK
jgi:hypothetical protein